MQRIRAIQIDGRYAIRGKEVRVASIFNFGPKGGFAKVVTLKAADGHGFKLTQWPDGTIYRVSKLGANQ